jgi:exodeoxyribonuclease (lambda-induced)
MERGNVLESESRNLYELIKGTDVKQVSLVYKDESRLVACSPDGLIGYDVVHDRFCGGYETKCPAPHTHVEYLLANKLPTKYKVQVQGSMYVTGMDHWDFMSYHPHMPPLIIKVERDTRFIKLLSDEIDLFLEEMLEKREKLQTLK